MLRATFAGLALLSAVWSVTLGLAGGIDATVAGVHVSSNNPAHPLIVALLATVAYVTTAGARRLGRDAAWLRAQVTAVRVAAALTLAIGLIGIAHNSWSAGGSDSYSYVSQMDLWLHGDLKVPVPLARTAPWPDALTTFAPLGYRTVPNELAIAPVTGPGLPLLMAAFKFVGGHAAGFLVAPLSGALLVWATFLLGRRLFSSGLGLGAAWLVAASPTFLMMFKSQMSDVPAAAFWTLALYCTKPLNPSRAVGVMTSRVPSRRAVKSP